MYVLYVHFFGSIILQILYCIVEVLVHVCTYLSMIYVHIHTHVHRYISMYYTFAVFEISFFLSLLSTECLKEHVQQYYTFACTYVRTYVYWANVPGREETTHMHMHTRMYVLGCVTLSY